MAKNEENSKKTKVSKEVVKNTKEEKIVKDEPKSIVKETIKYDNTPILNKIVVCLYIIIALFVVNIFMNVISSNTNTTSGDYRDTTTNDSSDSSSETTEYDVSKFTEIDADGFIDAYNGSELSLIYIGRPTCGYCVKFVPVLTEVQESYNFTTLYLDIDEITSDDAQNIINLNSDFFTNENTAFGNTPTTLIVKNGEIVDYQIGASDASTLEALVKQYFDKK